VDASTPIDPNKVTFVDGKAVDESFNKEKVHESPDFAIKAKRAARLSTERLPLLGTELNLSDRNLTAEKAKAICEHLRNSAVSKLILNNNQLGDTGARELAMHLRTDFTLTHLGLHGNGIGDIGVLALAEALKANNTLRSLFLTGNLAAESSLGMLRAANAARPSPMQGLNGLVTDY